MRAHVLLMISRSKPVTAVGFERDLPHACLCATDDPPLEPRSSLSGPHDLVASATLGGTPNEVDMHIAARFELGGPHLEADVRNDVSLDLGGLAL